MELETNEDERGNGVGRAPSEDMGTQNHDYLVPVIPSNGKHAILSIKNLASWPASQQASKQGKVCTAQDLGANLVPHKQTQYVRL